jgi:hypothetical protein
MNVQREMASVLTSIAVCNIFKPANGGRPALNLWTCNEIAGCL